MLRKLPIILILLIIAILALHSFIPMGLKQFLYAISLTVKSFIIFLLPLIIFGLLFKTMVDLAKGATLVILLILLCVCASNFTSTFLSHFVGEWVYHLDISIINPPKSQELLPSWTWQFPKLIANDKAMFAGIIFGIIFGNFMPKIGQRLGKAFDLVVTKILSSFAYLIPLFVAGFIIKLQYDGIMQIILKDYPRIFVMVALAQFTYILFLYLALNRFTISKFLLSVKNMLPAAIAGFSTMSSAAAMPLTIVGVESNTKNKELAGSVVPATVNIHLIGDCFAIPIFAYAIMKSFGIAEPSLLTYLTFVIYFVIAKFSVAAIPGGGIIVMLPILESTLGFKPDMLSLITALYVLFDPVITCANVLGNGAFAKLIDNIVTFYQQKCRSKSNATT
jgi:Na+/H+-dicarboxylate symporter